MNITINSILRLQYNKDEINFLRQKIKDIFCENILDNVNNLYSISDKNLQRLFYLYDEYFFNNFFSSQDFLPSLKFTLSSRMTRAAGKTIIPRDLERIPEEKRIFEIRMSTYFLSNYNQVRGEKRVNGIVTTDPFHAFQLVLEHEICHIIEFVGFGTSSCKKKRFKNFAYQLFGHTESYHELSVPKEKVKVHNHVQVGDIVYFFYKNKKIIGIIHRITKRATVMVEDKRGVYVDHKNRRHTKYYVPINELRLLH